MSWTSVIMSFGAKPLRIPSDKQPELYQAFHLEDKSVIYFTKVSEDEERKEAYFIKGYWGPKNDNN